MNRVHVQRLTHSWCIFVILTHARNDEKISEKIEKFENKWCVTEKLQQMYNSESAGEKKVLKDLFGFRLLPLLLSLLWLTYINFEWHIY